MPVVRRQWKVHCRQKCTGESRRADTQLAAQRAARPPDVRVGGCVLTSGAGLVRGGTALATKNGLDADVVRCHAPRPLPKVTSLQRRGIRVTFDRAARPEVPAIAGRCIDVTFGRSRAAPAVPSDGEPWEFRLPCHIPVHWRGRAEPGRGAAGPPQPVWDPAPRGPTGQRLQPSRDPDGELSQLGSGPRNPITEVRRSCRSWTRLERSDSPPVPK
jgi:hypothetical protein